MTTSLEKAPRAIKVAMSESQKGSAAPRARVPSLPSSGGSPRDHRL